MSELKRKREDGDEGEAGVAGACSLTSSLSSVSQANDSSQSATTGACSSGDGAGADSGECKTETGDAGASASALSASARPAGHEDGSATIIIRGEEVVLKGTAGRKKRKHSVQTLIVLAYKGSLALACKANDMVAALDIYREMKSKGIKQDLSVSVLPLARMVYCIFFGCAQQWVWFCTMMACLSSVVRSTVCTWFEDLFVCTGYCCTFAYYIARSCCALVNVLL